MPLRPEDAAHVGEAYGLRARSVLLHPLRPEYFDFLCELALTGEIPWEWSGLPESVDAFRETLLTGHLCQFVPVSRRSGRPLGLVRATSANFFYGHASISIYFAKEHRRTTAFAESMATFVDFLFRRYSFRKLYADTISPLYEHFASGEGRYFTVEGRFRDFALLDGEYVDKLVLTIDGEVWKSVRQDLLGVVIAPPPT